MNRARWAAPVAAVEFWVVYSLLVVDDWPTHLVELVVLLLAGGLFLGWFRWYQRQSREFDERHGRGR